MMSSALIVMVVLVATKYTDAGKIPVTKRLIVYFLNIIASGKLVREMYTPLNPTFI